jgi:diamine N-acetyltransferase
MSDAIQIRSGSKRDAITIAALATQVFLDTYATNGVRPDLAREAFHTCSEQAFSARLAESTRKFIVAERGHALVGFAEVLWSNVNSPASAISGAELVRLYVQPRAQRASIGCILIQEVERLVALDALHSLWLTVWERNANALAFYRRMGYAEVGATTYSFEGKTYGNLVYAKQLEKNACLAT